MATERPALSFFTRLSRLAGFGIPMLALAPSVFADLPLVQYAGTMRYLANASDPGLGMTWTLAGFDDQAWTQGEYGAGFEGTPPGALNLIRTTVPMGLRSIYTRSVFTVEDLARVDSLVLGADYDDGYAAWINGVEVYRSPEMPPGALAWNSTAVSHESSNGTSPVYGALVDITATGRPALVQGANVLSVAVWNTSAGSSDMVVVPLLAIGSPVTRGPYLQSGSSTGLVVRWRTATAESSGVWAGADPNDMTLRAAKGILSTEHELAITGLSPHTTYSYMVGTAAAPYTAEISSFTTPPVPGTAQPTHIWVLGDSGTANSSARAVRDAYRSYAGSPTPDLWLMLGDNAYETGTDAQYQAAVFDMYPDTLRTSVLWSTYGNHESLTADAASQSGPYFDMFTFPRQGEAGGVPSGTEAYYSFDHANIHFICLESDELDHTTSGPMLTWLQQDLAATTQEWIVAFWHHPPYSKGSHDSDSESQLRAMRQNALPILEQGGVDLVLSGHSHSYERSMMLDGHYGDSTTLTPSMILDGGNGSILGDGAYIKPPGGELPHAGAVYVVSGSSGNVTPGTLDHPVMLVSLATLGSLVLDVNGPQLDARFLDSTAMVRDNFTLYKGPMTPPVAQFVGAPVQGTVPLQVGFTDTSSGPVSYRSWDFEDDGVVDSQGEAPGHSYAQPGIYSVRLTVQGPTGSSARLETAMICALSSSGTGDADGDATPDQADNCPCAQNPGQPDLDADGLGDACDADDDQDGIPDAVDCEPMNSSAELKALDPGNTLQMDPLGRLIWSRKPAATASNVYRGLLDPDGFSYSHACKAASLTSVFYQDTAPVPVGKVAYYLVSGRAGCRESALGKSSAGAPTPNNAPCP